jgi:4-amino-4-deoxy-L-arabinose transferase-like glycosyltransferase
MLRSTKFLSRAIELAAAITFTTATASYLDSPLRDDETDWPRQARAIAAHGVPRVSFAEDRVQHGGSFYGYDAVYGLEHPPLYNHTLAAAYAIGGDRDWVYRGVSLLCLIGALIVIRKTTGTWLAVAVPLLSPLVVDGALRLDIDNTTLLLSMTLVMWSALRPGDPARPVRIGELALLLCLALWSKLTTPFVLMAALVAYAALGPQRRRHAGAMLLASAAAITLFAVSYWIYCTVFRLPASYMFDVSYVGKQNLYASVKRVRDILFAVRWSVVWVSPIMWLLLTSVTLRRIGRWWRTRSVEPVDLFVLFSWATFACYALLGAMWGKYMIPPAVIGGAAIGAELAKAWPSVRVERPRAFVGGLAVVALAAAVLPVPYARPGPVDLASTVRALALDPRNLSALMLVVMSLGFAAAARRWLRADTPARMREVALAACLAVVTPVMVARVVVSQDDRGPLRPFSDRGFRATVDWLNGSGAAGSVILSEKDFGQYFHGRVFPLEDLLSAGGQAAALTAARRPDVRYIVDSSKYPLLTPGFDRQLDIVRTESVGDFRIHVKR